MRTGVVKAIPGLIALALVVVAGVYLGRPRTIYGNPTGEIPLEMPAELGGYRAERIRFCTNDQCSRAFRESELVMTNEVPATVEGEAASAFSEDPGNLATNCLVCGSPLSAISIGEAKLLPDNTPIFRRVYLCEGSTPVQVTIVFSGIERRSIHRPQVCLVSQGNRITNEQPYDVDLGDGQTLRIRVLDIQQVFGDEGDEGEKAVIPATYAYWLFNPERETDSHLERFLHMAIDNSLRNYRPRWGYVSISFERTSLDPNAWKRQLDEFVPLIHPVLTDVRKKLDAQRNITNVIHRSSSEMNVYEGGTGDVTENPHVRRKPDPVDSP
ncbi:MAG: exosortase-associated EpsI family protein [Kiritimatiellia bacterium]|jgi:hypothetical protein